MKNFIGADATKLAGLQIDLLQKLRSGQVTLDHLEWFNMLSKERRDKLAGANVVDDRFKLVTSFNIVVPHDYDHATRLGSFKRKHGKEFHFYNDAITDKNFTKATSKLTSGRKMKVDVYEITKRVSSEDCLAFLKSRKAIFTGAQGASLVYEQVKYLLPKGRCYVSFDEKDALLKDTDGDHGVPIVNALSDSNFNFLLDIFESPWFDSNCLLCFRDR